MSWAARGRRKRRTLRHRFRLLVEYRYQNNFEAGKDRNPQRLVRRDLAVSPKVLLIRHRRTGYWTALRDYRFVIYFWLGRAQIFGLFPPREAILTKISSKCLMFLPFSLDR